MTFVLHSNVNRRFLSKCGLLSRTVSPLKYLYCGPVNRLNWVAISRSRDAAPLRVWYSCIFLFWEAWSAEWGAQCYVVLTLPWRQAWKFGLFLFRIPEIRVFVDRYIALLRISVVFSRIFLFCMLGFPPQAQIILGIMYHNRYISYSLLFDKLSWCPVLQTSRYTHLSPHQVSYHGGSLAVPAQHGSVWSRTMWELSSWEMGGLEYR